MTYPQAIKYLESFINYEKIPAYPYKQSLKLERIKGFLESIGNPHLGLKCIHIAGTKGKGSTCAFLTYILREAGFKVGLYTSPHLADFRERIRILGCQAVKFPGQRIKDFEGMIPKKDLARLIGKLKPAIDKFNAESEYGPLTFFEGYTAIAFAYFKERNADFAVLETGLGGRLDATNVVNPLVCAITPISYEHMDKLGNTLGKIAAEKAGIIKTRGLTVITAPQKKEVLTVIRERCRITGAKLNKTGKFDFKTRLIGAHQKINAAVAVGAIEALRNYGISINAAAIKRGLTNTLWPGRCEVISKTPLIVLDGAQNVASAQALKKAIKDNFEYKKLILILGISSDKDIAGICRELLPLADTTILTQANSPRAADVDVIEKIARGKIIKTRKVKEAKRIALKLAGKKDLILVTGSLFVVGEFRYDKR